MNGYQNLLKNQSEPNQSEVWGLYHKTYYGRNGFRNKPECLSLNTRLGWKGLPGTNTLAYYRNRKLRL